MAHANNAQPDQIALLHYATVVRLSTIQGVHEDSIRSARPIAFANHDGIVFYDNVTHTACRAVKVTSNLSTHRHRVCNVGKNWLLRRWWIYLVQHAIRSNNVPVRQRDILWVPIKQDSESMCVLFRTQVMSIISGTGSVMENAR
jgi:hypothetical protein